MLISSASIMNRQKAVQRTNNIGAWQKGIGKVQNVLMQAAGFLHRPALVCFDDFFKGAIKTLDRFTGGIKKRIKKGYTVGRNRIQI